MPIQNLKYCEYFDVKEKYFPCIDESAIRDGAAWKNTYPHESFIQLLNNTEKMLGGSTNRSLWIYGAYGTGKSQCAHALRNILETSEAEVREYWNTYEPLRKQPVLLEKLLGHKEQGVVVAYRYASGSISTLQQLFLAVQESIKEALIRKNISYMGENTLKESVISWLEKKPNNDYMTALLQEPKWMAAFSQDSANEIINSLRKSSDVTGLMNNIFALAAEEGITALNITSDSLRSWIVDVIRQNHIKIVLIWDEFSDFFRQNKDSLGEFQKIVAICQEVPFYFVIVTHPLSSIASKLSSGNNEKDSPWSIVRQRFEKVEITLPDNIAFDLIGAAFDVKPSAKATWQVMTEGLSQDVAESQNAIMKAANIQKKTVMRDILPIHPVAALVLKNIASAFQSNQRSMFDFIKKPKDLDVQAFQYFIQNTTPLSERPFLTVDMLWDFFYEKGKDYLTSDIKLILDTFPQQHNLVEKEKIVLKTILIMQAIDQRLGGAIPVLKPTDQNLFYAFEGDKTGLDTGYKGIARALVDKGILIQTPMADGKKVYAAAVLAGDSARIDSYKKEIKEKSTTAKLVAEGPALKTALALSPALKLRYAANMETGELPIVTISDFVKAMESLKNKEIGWHFYAVLALAKTEDEAQDFRALIRKTIVDEAFRNIIVIDALSTPLGVEAFDKYVDFSAMSSYYQGNNNQQAKDNARKAKEVLERDWKDRIHDGQFIVYSYSCQDGEKATGATALQAILRAYVLKKYRYVPDFTEKLTESQLKLTQGKQAARVGMGDVEVRGLILGCERTVLGKVWNRKDYWTDSTLAIEPIVVIKKALDKVIADAFKDSGKISIEDIYNYLEGEFGFSPCNLTAFIVGFLLKEYSRDPFRSMDSEGHRESMTPDKLAEMIGNFIGKSNPKATYIVSLTEEEKAFYELTETAWGIKEGACSSPQHAASLILSKMRELSYPVWCLEDIDKHGVFDLVKKYSDLVQCKGDNAHDIANEIGKIAMQRPSAGSSLRELLTADNCKKGMESFLNRFENGKLYTLADEIGARNSVLPDIKHLFSIQYSALWLGTTGEDEIRKLIVEYDVIKQTNLLLNVSAHSKNDAFQAWRESLKFVGYSCEAAKTKYPVLEKFFDFLLKIVNKEDMLPEYMQSFLDEIVIHFTEIHDVLSNPLHVFQDIYNPYLTGLTDVECESVKNSIASDLFITSSTQSNAIVKKAAADFKNNQAKTKLFKLWSDKAQGTKNPRDWSRKFRTPILALIPMSQYSEAKKAFDVLNSSFQSENEIEETFCFVEKATFFDDIAQQEYRDEWFAKNVLGDYSIILTEVNQVRDALEELTIDTYDWKDSPIARKRISDLAQAEYNAGGSDKVISMIQKMSPQELQIWLSNVIKNDMGLGVKILKNERR